MMPRIEDHDSCHLKVVCHVHVVDLTLVMSEIRYCWYKEMSDPSPASPCLGACDCRHCFAANLDNHRCLGEDPVAWYSLEEVSDSAEEALLARGCSRKAVSAIDAQS
jgi:hypothetical protein